MGGGVGFYIGAPIHKCLFQLSEHWKSVNLSLKSTVKGGFKGHVVFSFPHVDPDLGVLFEKITAKGVIFEKHTLHTMPQGLGISCKACLLF